MTLLKIVKGIFRDKKESWEKRKKKKKERKYKWNPKLEDRVLIKGQNQLDDAKGVTDRFIHVYKGPCIINKI